jgi:alpha-glucosidase (family GH31 glycosyl hydrolase)
MKEVPSHFQLSFAPVANPGAVVHAGEARFTVLSSRLLRLEYDAGATFMDRPSQLVWYRQQPVPDFHVLEAAGAIEITTEHLKLRYRVGEPFAAVTLAVELREQDNIWHFGEVDGQNLGGTVRTLDQISGTAPLEPGLLSRAGRSIIDDSRSLIFNENGWLEARPNPEALDLYFFGYGHDYVAWLRDYMKIAGRVPLLPRWALGNWWSRYWAYSAEELMALMHAFRAHEVPLAVCIVDMDWHITNTGNDSRGWTGYTWNRELFPDPEAFLRWLHEQGLKAALNLHPADGVHPHEAGYEEVAAFMGIDAKTEAPVAFDIADPRYARAYFQLLHHPLEAEGVDFWWIDWQQGEKTGLPHLDPLWWLNHLHFYDRARDGKKRPFILSRWGGLGNHRYPIGFSGDNYVNWPSLAFQPYLTATAANVGFSWWSHDIGGHMHGVEEPELYARWVQFGTFSPILRLHSTKNPYHERRPWGHDAEILRVTRAAMQLRHALIPYTYTMSWRNYHESIALIRPMYHDYPEMEAAYHCPDQYTFGSELLAAPYVRPAGVDTRLSRQVVWLPPGTWFDFFDGCSFAGDSWHTLYGALDEIPVFARAGAIVPLGRRVGWGGVANPERLEVVVFPGADNDFELYEDDGETLAYHQGAYALTPFSQRWQDDRLAFGIGPVRGDGAQVPRQRTYALHFRGIARPSTVTLALNGRARQAGFTYDEQTHTAHLAPQTLAPGDRLTVTVAAAGDLARRDDFRLARCQRMVARFRMQTTAKAALAQQLPAVIAEPGRLAPYAVELTDGQRRALLEVISGAGVDYNTHTGTPFLVMWNNRQYGGATYRLSAVHGRRWSPRERFRAETGALPRFRAIVPAETMPDAAWELAIAYDNVLSFTLGTSQR